MTSNNILNHNSKSSETIEIHKASIQQSFTAVSVGFDPENYTVSDENLIFQEK